LISNAIKFTRNQNPAKIEFGCYSENDEPVYFLRDNGIGFNMNFASQLFLPFQRLHASEEFSGFGIGLTLVKKLIELHNGQIWMDSKEGQGTTVYFKIKDLAPEGFKITDLI
jgi:light-regulated signal transduction histidine kinase (bacteriophytochrome)